MMDELGSLTHKASHELIQTKMLIKWIQCELKPQRYVFITSILYDRDNFVTS